jgi:hypothetical protein
MGCCGRDFPGKGKIEEAIKKNTAEFYELNPKTEEELLAFRDRRPASDLRNGVCRNLIEDKEKLFCPLHPKRNNGKDLRKGHCDVDYFCKTAKIFMTWSEEKQQKFVKFIEDKKLDNINYSIMMDRNRLLEEFTK